MTGVASELVVVLHAVGWGVLHAAWIGGLAVGGVALIAGSRRRLASSAAQALALATLLVLASLPWTLGGYMVREYLEHADWVARTERQIQADAAPGAPREPTIGLRLAERHRGLYRSPFEGEPARAIGLAVAAVAVAWLVLAGLRSAALAREWIVLRRALASAELPDARGWGDVLEILRGRLGVEAPVRLAISPHGSVPMVTGIRRPTVLVPARVYASLDPRHVLPILAHELAHVARRDLISNVVQRVAEVWTGLVPGAGWLSARLENDRECATDARTCATLGIRKAAYAEALLALECSRAEHADLALAAGGEPGLLDRVRRLERTPLPEPRHPVFLAGCAAGAVLSAVLAVTAFGPLFRLSVEVVMEHDLGRRVVAERSAPTPADRAR